jgi:uncharacterized repeat protein (TIGR01451 family)
MLALALPATAGADQTMFGVNVNRIFNDGPGDTDWTAQLSAVHATGISVARSDAFWDQVETSPPSNGIHNYNWSYEDLIAQNLAGNALRWQPILDYSAPWASSDPQDTHAPPTSNDDYAAYAGAFARRYGRNGTYWLTHPTQPSAPVTTYEIWNEENDSWAWQPHPDPAQYADMYLKARAAIKAVDPGAIVLVGGLLPHTTFLQDMYNARPDVRGSVDGVAIHPYARSPYDVFREVREFRAQLDSVGAGPVTLYVTELGWVTSGNGSDLVVSDQQRASYLAQTTDGLARSDCGIGSITPYTWTTPEHDPANPEDWYGMYHWNGGGTATSAAYAGVIARWSSDPPGRVAGPAICHGADSDGDGYADSFDPCPFDPAIHDHPCPADLEVRESASDASTSPGATVRYTVTVVNHGPYRSDGVVLADTLSGGAVSAGACAEPPCWIGTLAPGASATFTVVARAGTSGALANVASVTSRTEDDAPANDVASASASILRFAGIRFPKRKVMIDSHGVAWITAECPHQTAGRCRGQLTLQFAVHSAGRVHGSRFSLAPGRRARLRLRLPASVVARARARRRLSALAVALTRDAFSTVAATKGRVTLEWTGR